LWREFLPRSRKTAKWPVTSAHILDESEFMVLWVRQLIRWGQPCGCLSKNLMGGCPRPQWG
jgi:hypothetical protein